MSTDADTIDNIEEQPPRWFERLSDFANPILVKEARQSLKSRQFVITFSLLLLASWLLSVFNMLLAGDSLQFGAVGGTFFSMYYGVLCIAILLVVPFGAYRSLLLERDQNTFEILSITTLTPKQIVWGKLCSALLQIFIFFSAIAPFIAFASLLQGFDLPMSLFVLTLIFLGSLGSSMIALMLSTLGRSRQWQTIVSLIVLGLLLWLSLGMLTLGIAITSTGFNEFDDPDFWWGCGFSLVVGISFFVLCQQITTSQLTFASDNHSTPIRVTCSAQILLLWGGYLGYFWFSGTTTSAGEHAFITTCSIAYTAIAGFFFAMESNFLSRRIRRELPRNRLLRLISIPYMPGGNRGLVWLLLHLAAGGLLSFVSNRSSWSWGNDLVNATWVGIAYTVIFLGIGTAMTRIGELRTTFLRSAHARVLTLLFIAGGSLLPTFVVWVCHEIEALRHIFPNFRQYTVIHMLNPFESIDHVGSSGAYTGIVMLSVTGAAMFVVLINLPAMFGATRQIMAANIKQLPTGLPHEQPVAQTT